jgi:alkanesulfonate monooxygenase SsuD/methylene tetrahydromethanopterin reductase-like flavin-dependent oxidoreductase (luciferase family)
MMEHGRMALGLMLPLGTGAMGGTHTARWADLRAMAETAEAVGLSSLVVPDHLLFRRSPPGNNPMVDMPEGQTRGIWEAWTILTAVAAVTRRIALAPFVACTAFRNPALLAKMADTLDEVSGGRLHLGLGAGWHEPEFQAFGYPFDHRVGRFEEAVRIIVPLLRGERVDVEGRYYQARECQLLPRGPRPGGLPIFIGAQGPRMLRLAARWADRFDADFQFHAAGVGERYAAFDAACREVGRDPATVARSAGARLAILGGAGGAGPPGIPAPAVGEGFAEYRLAGARFVARRGTPAELAAYLRGFEAAGVGQLTCTVVDPPGVPGVERLAEVLAALRV